MPTIPAGGPAQARFFHRIGIVRAHRLHAHQPWTRQTGEQLHGDAGDWRVLDEGGDERTVRDTEFRLSHEPVSGDRWRRIGIFRAWQVGETQVLRTLEGRATADPGDWIVEGHRGERWPVRDSQFWHSYAPCQAQTKTRLDHVRRVHDLPDLGRERRSQDTAGPGRTDPSVKAYLIKHIRR